MKKAQKRKFQEVIEHGIGDYPENWIDDNISPYDIEPYIFPNEEILNKNNIHSHYFSYYFKWSVNDNYRYVQKNCLILEKMKWEGPRELLQILIV